MKYFFLTLLLAIVGIVIWQFVAMPESIPLQTYTNTTYGYSLKYPASFESREYTPENVAFGYGDETSMQGIAEARVMIIQGTTTETFEQALIGELLNLCAADGPNVSISCIGIDGVQPFLTTSSVQGFSIYLRGETRNLTTQETAPVGKGPFFVFLLRVSATGSSVLVIHPPLNQNTEESDSGTVRSIAGSVIISQ